MKIGLAQYDFTVGDLGGNCEKILIIYQKALHQQLDLLVFPELALSGYSPEDFLLRDDFLRALEQTLATLQQSIGAVPIILGCPMQRDGVLQNCALLIRDGAIRACYAKQCLPNYGVFDEKRYFVAGQEPCVIQLTPNGPKLGLLICEDLWYVAPAVRAQQAGAEVLISIHASPFALGKEVQRSAVYAAACQASGLPLLATFLVGAQDELCFDGGARAVNAEGVLVAQADFFTEQLLVVELAETKAGIVPVSTMRVTTEYAKPLKATLDDEVARVYQALVLGIRDYVHKNNFNGVLLGLSGGIDSSLTFLLAIDALGVEKVTAVSMPSCFTTPLSAQAVEEQIALTGGALVTLPIHDVFEAALDTLAPIFAGLAPDKTEENIQARCRGLLLMALSNKNGALVLSTGNKSEMAMGYSTLYGDMVGGFAALKDVPKTLVFALARYRNTINYQIPDIIINRPPTAELALNQTDQDSLPPYEILDEILYRSIELNESAETIIAAGFDAKTVRRVIAAVYANEYKRRQAPPGIKITLVSFTRERRYPITGARQVCAAMLGCHPTCL